MNIAAIVRIIVLVLAIVNQLLASKGLSPIPVDEETIATIITTVVGLYVAWKNNSFTKEAKQSDAKLKQLKAEKKLAKVSGKSPIKEVEEDEGNI